MACVLVAAVAAQPAGELELRAAVAAEPGDLARYFRLADYFVERKEPHRADEVLRDALGVDPSARSIHERRVRLFAEPFEAARVGGIALEWLTVDGTNPTPVLLATGHRLRRASALRGYGTRAAEDELDLALQALDGALPANPDHAGLMRARAQLLLGKAALAADATASERLLAEAAMTGRRAQRLASERASSAGAGDLAAVVSAMLRPPPFGPTGAVRLPVPPRLLTDPWLPQARGSGRFRLLPLEVAVDVFGRVIQIHPIDSSEGYTAAIAEALGRRRYEATTHDGQPVPAIFNIQMLVR